MNSINIARDFSIYPGGRTPDDGPASGEEFREHFLVPVLDASGKATIDFDGTRGYGSSFLEEAFGGLVRRGYLKDLIISTFIFVSKKQSVIDEIKRYIDEEQQRVAQ